MNEGGGVRTHAIDISALNRDTRQLSLADEDVCLRVSDLDLYYGDKQALKEVNLTLPRHRVTAFIGPSGCGKSTLLRCSTSSSPNTPSSS